MFFSFYSRGDLPPFLTKKRGFWSIQPTQGKDRINLLFQSLLFLSQYFMQDSIRKMKRFAPLKKSAGFSLVEVLGAMMILSIALVALMENQSSSLQLTKKSLLLDQATSLAQGKMAELTVQANSRSFAEFPETGEGEFEDEGLQRFSWRYQTQPVEAPDFAAMAKVAMGSDESDTASEGNASMLDGPLKSVTEAWSKALLQLRVEILWKEGNSEKSYAVVTHLVDEQAASNIAGMVKGMSQAFGGGNNEEGASE